MGAVLHEENYGMFKIPHLDEVGRVLNSADTGNIYTINGTLAPKSAEKPATADVSSGEMAKNLLIARPARLNNVPRPHNVYAELLEIGEEIERCRQRSC